jgi:neutral trehalase
VPFVDAVPRDTGAHRRRVRFGAAGSRVQPASVCRAAVYAADHRKPERPDRPRVRNGDAHSRALADAPTLAAAAPLYFGLATPEQGRAVAARLEREFLKPGGFVTTQIASGQQWDAPNGWPPLEWLAIEVARRYDRADLERTARERWLALNRRTYAATGRMMEKYDVVDLDQRAGGGEYPTQDGFGWTNGVALALIARWPPPPRSP